MAAVTAMRRLAAGRSRPTGAQVNGVARRYGVTAATAYRWWRDRALHKTKAPRRAPRLEITTPILTVLADQQSVRDTHAVLTASGTIDVSYSTLARALQQADPALVQGALHGAKGLMNSTVYKRLRAPHKAHTYHFDHTVLDAYVMPSHKHTTPVRPHITVVVDSASSYVLAVVLLAGHPNQNTVAAALAQASLVRVEHGVEVGGTPEQLVCDNAAEHFAETVRDAAAAVGWIFAPTRPRASNQNGRAENFNQQLARVMKKMPGAVRIGMDEEGHDRALERSRGTAQPASLLVWGAMSAFVEAFRHKINRDIRVKDFGGLTRSERWAADPPELRRIEPELLRNVMLPTARHPYKASGSGISFGSRFYIGPGIKRGHDYRIRYLPGEHDFVVVYDLDNRFVTEARPSEHLDGELASEYEAGRARTEREVRAINLGVKQHRAQLALVANSLYDDESTDYDGADELAAAVGADLDVLEDIEDGCHDAPADSDPVTDDRGSGPDVAAGAAGAPARTTAPPADKPRRGQRPSLPRATEAATAEPNAELVRANDLLADRFGPDIKAPGVTTVAPDSSQEERK